MSAFSCVRRRFSADKDYRKVGRQAAARVPSEPHRPVVLGVSLDLMHIGAESCSLDWRPVRHCLADKERTVGMKSTVKARCFRPCRPPCLQHRSGIFRQRRLLFATIHGQQGPRRGHIASLGLYSSGPDRAQGDAGSDLRFIRRGAASTRQETLTAPSFCVPHRRCRSHSAAANQVPKSTPARFFTSI